MYNYFPHPSNARQSAGCVSLLIEEGFAGYGIYWAILEVLRDAPGYRYNPEPKVWAYLLHCADLDQVSRVLRNYELFSIDENGRLFSPWLDEQLGAYDEQKAKLREAGRRGAAKRWGAQSLEDSKPIASLSLEDSKPIAHNIMSPNIIEDNPTLPNVTDSPRISMELVEALSSTNPQGHGVGFVAQELQRYGCTEATLNLICERSENAKVGNSTYQAFCALVKRIQAENWTPKHPDGFFLKKLFA